MSSADNPHFYNRSIPRPGIGSQGSYLVSGFPWTTGSYFGASEYWVKITFPNVTKSFTVINKDPQQLHPSGTITGGGELVVFFGPEPTSSTELPRQIHQNHYITIPALNDSFTFDIRCKEFFIGTHTTGSNIAYQILAELTPIESREMPALSGSGIQT